MEKPSGAAVRMTKIERKDRYTLQPGIVRRGRLTRKIKEKKMRTDPERSYLPGRDHLLDVHVVSSSFALQDQDAVGGAHHLAAKPLVSVSAEVDLYILVVQMLGYEFVHHGMLTSKKLFGNNKALN